MRRGPSVGEGATTLHKALFAAACTVLPVAWGLFMEWVSRTVFDAIGAARARKEENIDTPRGMEGES